ncbi:MAG: tyrosine-type recombinase/integrase [Myxococcaceae bacterium]
MKISWNPKKELFYACVNHGRRADGSRIRTWVYGQTRQDVRAKLKEALTTDKPKSEDKTTVADFIKTWLAGAKLRPSTRERYECVLNNHFVPYVGDVQLRHVDYDLLNEWKRQREGAGVSARNLHMAYVVAKTMFQEAYFGGKVRVNPMARVKAPEYTAPDMDERMWTPEEAEQFLASVCREDDAYAATYVLAWHCGMRLGEILGLRWDRLDFDKKTIRVDAQINEVKGAHVRDQLTTEPKTKKGKRVVGMTEMVLGLLKARRALVIGRGFEKVAPDSLVFQTRCNDVPPTKASFTAHWHRAQRKAGVPEVTFHTLRHLNASTLLMQGAKPLDVQRHLGHSNVRTTMGIYAHLLERQEKGSYAHALMAEMIEKARTAQ